VPRYHWSSFRTVQHCRPGHCHRTTSRTHSPRHSDTRMLHHPHPVDCMRLTSNHCQSVSWQRAGYVQKLRFFWSLNWAAGIVPVKELYASELHPRTQPKLVTVSTQTIARYAFAEGASPIIHGVGAHISFHFDKDANAVGMVPVNPVLDHEDGVPSVSLMDTSPQFV
jgi:hypothetical protein